MSPCGSKENVYEIRVKGNVPVSIQGLFHRTAKTPAGAKRALAHYLKSRLKRKDISIKTIVNSMSATKL